MSINELEEARLRQEVGMYKKLESEKEREGLINGLFEEQGAKHFFKPITSHLEELVKVTREDNKEKAKERNEDEANVKEEGAVVGEEEGDGDVGEDEGAVGGEEEDEGTEGGEDEEEEEEEEKIAVIFKKGLGKEKQTGVPGLKKAIVFANEIGLKDNDMFPPGVRGAPDYFANHTIEELEKIVYEKKINNSKKTPLKISKEIQKKRKKEGQSGVKKTLNFVGDKFGKTIGEYFTKGKGLGGGGITKEQRKKIMDELRRYTGSIRGGNTSQEAYDTILRDLSTLIEARLIRKEIAEDAMKKITHNK